ncbi:MAG: PDZ domain-containing protein [Burkholderiales bacterium]|nr:PDZ domain-containing protein [Burkholderiales bacterium]
MAVTVNSQFARWFKNRWPDLLAFGLLIVLCWLLARWTWLIVSPEAIAEAAGSTRVSIDTAAAADSIVAAHLFGTAEAPRPVVQAAVPTSLNVKLKGVFSAVGKQPAYAILNSDNQGDRHIKAGSEVKAGVVLAEIHPQHVVLSRDGVMELVELEEKAGGAPQKSNRLVIPPRQPAPKPAAPAQPATSSAPAIQSGIAPGAPQAAAADGFNLTVKPAGANQYSFSRKELNQALQDPKQLQNLGGVAVNPTGGVTISNVPAGSLTQKLGLQQGDVLTRINGQAVSSNNDLARLYQQFGQVNQITVEGTRNGKPMNLSFTVQQ